MSTRRERPRRFRRIITRVVVFLLLGAVVNVGVAWAFSIDVDRSPGTKLLNMQQARGFAGNSSQTGGWSFIYSNGTGAERVRANRKQYYVDPPDNGMLPGWSRLRKPDAAFGSGSTVNAVTEFAFGWPLRALMFHSEASPDAGLQIIGCVRAPEVLQQWGAGGFLPLEIIWPHFAVNTLLYATVLWLPFAPFTVRRVIRWRRASRGRCVRCGYDLTGTEHDVCPECGQ